MKTTSTAASAASSRALQRALLALLAVLPMASASAQESSSAEAREAAADKIDRARDTLEKWVEARKTISKERRDWSEGQSVLEDRIALLQREIEDVRAKIADAAASVAEAEKKRQELEVESEALKSSSVTLKGIAERLEGGTKKLLQRLPQFAQDRVKLFSQRIPDAEAETKLSLSERFQSVVAVLNDMNKLNREITLTPEIRELSDGRMAEVATAYVGLGQGYYASATGTMAGVGYASETAWEWRASNEEAGEIARMIAILKNENVADFVRLPVVLR